MAEDRRDRRSDDRATEHRLTNIEARLATAEDRWLDMSGKLDRLLSLAAAGKGAWWLLMGLGATLVGLVGLFTSMGWRPHFAVALLLIAGAVTLA